MSPSKIAEKLLVREAMSVFWQTLRDTWEELYSLAIVNLVWLFAWGLPIGLTTLSKTPLLTIPLIVLGVLVFPVVTAGVYYVANDVAHAKTFHFSDFVHGIKLYWWRSILWLLANVVFVILIWANLQFYPAIVQGSWGIIIWGVWVAVFVLWVMVQIYFWPILIQQEKPRLLLAWRNGLYLVLANPIYSFFMLSFTALLLALSVGLTLPFVFIGMTLQGLLGSNAVLILLAKFGLIDEPRPEPLH